MRTFKVLPGFVTELMRFLVVLLLASVLLVVWVPGGRWITVCTTFTSHEGGPPDVQRCTSWLGFDRSKAPWRDEP